MRSWNYQQQEQPLAILFPESCSTRNRSRLARTKKQLGCFRVVAFKNFGDGLLDYIEGGVPPHCLQIACISSQPSGGSKFALMQLDQS